jgi:hypothetical protein
VLFKDAKRIAYFSLAPVAGENLPNLSPSQTIGALTQVAEDCVDNGIAESVPEDVPSRIFAVAPYGQRRT